MAIFTGTLATDPPSDLAKLANDGRINLVSSTSIRWDGSVIGLWNGSSWAVCKPATLPSAINTSTDMNGTALAVDKIYDVFLNYSSVTSCPFAFSRWAASTAGSSARNAAYAAGTAYAIGDRVTYSGRDYTNIQAGTGQTPSSSPTYWVDNGTSVTGNFAGLYRHDGVLVSHNSDAGKKLRWLGNIYTYSNSGTVNFVASSTFCGISNYYNKRYLAMSKYIDGGGSTYTDTSWQLWTNWTTSSIRVLSCEAKPSVFMVQGAQSNSTGDCLCGLSINGADPSKTAGVAPGHGTDITSDANTIDSLVVGLNYLVVERRTTAGTASQFGSIIKARVEY